MWKNIVERERPRMTIKGMRIACWIPKATNTHSEYAIFCCSWRQQWLHEREAASRYTYIAFVVTFDPEMSRLLWFWIWYCAWQLHLVRCSFECYLLPHKNGWVRVPVAPVFATLCHEPRSPLRSPNWNCASRLDGCDGFVYKCSCSASHCYSCYLLVVGLVSYPKCVVILHLV